MGSRWVKVADEEALGRLLSFLHQQGYGVEGGLFTDYQDYFVVQVFLEPKWTEPDENGKQWRTGKLSDQVRGYRVKVPNKALRQGAEDAVLQSILEGD